MQSQKVVKFPVWLIVLYTISVLMAFVASIVQIDGALTLGSVQITLSPSQWAWLLPVSVILPLIVRIFLSRGGSFKWLGMEAEINIAREAKEAAHYADAKAQNVSKDYERAVADINAKIREIEVKTGLHDSNQEGNIGGSASENIKEMLQAFAEEYLMAAGPNAPAMRRETNKKVLLMPFVNPDTIFALTTMSWEYQTIGAILLRRLAEVDEQAGIAFDQLINLVSNGPNSLVRFRAANSLRLGDWKSIAPDMLNDRLDTLRKRKHIEPNGPTVNELELVINTFAALLK